MRTHGKKNATGEIKRAHLKVRRYIWNGFVFGSDRPGEQCPFRRRERRLAFGDLIAGIARLFEAALADLDGPQPHRRKPMSQEVPAHSVL